MNRCLLVLAAFGGLHAAPCAQGTAACQEKLPMGAQGRFVIIYRSHPLKDKSSKIKRALVVIHGAGRNADNYFSSGLAGAFLAGGLEDTIVVAPRFAGAGSNTCKDPLAAGEIAFQCSGNDWRGGWPGGDEPTVNTHGVVEALVNHFADKKR